MPGGRCWPGLSSFELNYACICAGSWKHALHHQRWAADSGKHAYSVLGGGNWLLEPLAKQGGEFEGSGSGGASSGLREAEGVYDCSGALLFGAAADPLRSFFRGLPLKGG